MGKPPDFAFVPRQTLMWIPWLLALLDALLTYVAGTSRDGLAMLIPYFAAYPFGFLLTSFSDWIAHSFIITDAASPTTQQYLLWNRIELTIFIIAGAIWFFLIGLVIRWLILRAVHFIANRKRKA